MNILKIGLEQNCRLYVKLLNFTLPQIFISGSEKNELRTTSRLSPVCWVILSIYLSGRAVCVLSQVKIYFTPSMFWVNLRLYRSWLKTKLVTRVQDFLHIAAETVRWLCLWEESSCMRYFCLIKWSFMQISINQSWLCNTAHQLLLWTRRHMEQITLKSQRLSSTLVLSSVFLICACI